MEISWYTGKRKRRVLPESSILLMRIINREARKHTHKYKSGALKDQSRLLEIGEIKVWFFLIPQDTGMMSYQWQEQHKLSCLPPPVCPPVSWATLTSKVSGAMSTFSVPTTTVPEEMPTCAVIPALQAEMNTLKQVATSKAFRIMKCHEKWFCPRTHHLSLNPFTMTSSLTHGLYLLGMLLEREVFRFAVSILLLGKEGTADKYHLGD